jgi:FkbM family methyltransferase
MREMPTASSLSQAVARYVDYVSWLADTGYSPSYGWYLRRFPLRIPLENIDDFLTTYDVYANGHYDRLYAEAGEGSVLLDIGANLGVTSLMFAQNPRVQRIYAFEPLPHTFACAERSLRANPEFGQRVELENSGVGGEDGAVEVRYTKKAKAAIGVSEIPQRLQKLYRIKPEDMESVVMRVVDAAKVVDRIREQHPGAPILLKLDAEGAEYGIVERLVASGRIAEIEAAAIEWHMEPGEPYLTSRLQAAGFQTTVKPLVADGSIGMIEAWR